MMKETQCSLVMLLLVAHSSGKVELAQTIQITLSCLLFATPKLIRIPPCSPIYQEIYSSSHVILKFYPLTRKIISIVEFSTICMLDARSSSASLIFNGVRRVSTGGRDKIKSYH
jgi:hypothetical protein